MLTCRDYNQAVDVYSMGLVLAELMYCSEPYAASSDFKTTRRFFFRGKSCFPITPMEDDDDLKDDQIIKILERKPNGDIK